MGKELVLRSYVFIQQCELSFKSDRFNMVKSDFSSYILSNMEFNLLHYVICASQVYIGLLVMLSVNMLYCLCLVQRKFLWIFDVLAFCFFYRWLVNLLLIFISFMFLCWTIQIWANVDHEWNIGCCHGIWQCRCSMGILEYIVNYLLIFSFHLNISLSLN